MKRRSFLKAVGGAVGAGALSGSAAAGLSQPAAARERRAAELPQRTLGRTGRNVSIIAFPGLALVRYDQDQCTAALHDAYRRGVNYFDVAPAYGRGDAEIKMGIGLQGIARDRIFLACKTKMRDKKGAREELERSLQRLKTDHFDLYQMHAMIKPEEVKQALGPGGAAETFLKAKQEGKVRHLGFSAHTTKAAIQALQGFPFDTVMFPISFAEMFTIGLGEEVLKAAKEKGAAVVAIKTMCRGAWPEGVEKTRKIWYRPVEDEKEIPLAVRFTLSQPGVAVAVPPSFFDLLDKAIDVAKAYRPITEPETETLRRAAKSCVSEFRRWEESVALGKPAPRMPHYCDNPHEAPPCAYA